MEGIKIPSNLSNRGQLAAETIVAVLKSHDMTYTGGCRTFYTPEEWKKRGEKYGHDAVLIVVHDGGDVASFFNMDYEQYALTVAMQNALGKFKLFAEPCTSWYTAIYEV